METKLFGTDPKFVDLSNARSADAATNVLSDLDNYELETETIEKDCWSYKNDCHYTETTGYYTYITSLDNDLLPGVFLFADDSNTYYDDDRPLTRENIQQDLEDFLSLPGTVEYGEDDEQEVDLCIRPIVTAWEWVGTCLMVRVWWVMKGD